MLFLIACKRIFLRVFWKAFRAKVENKDHLRPCRTQSIGLFEAKRLRKF